uniref:RNA helicase n=1 Tax=Calidris pygmaea TaxID=425635 RepID=A0A8C3PK94_9CHAR
SSLRLLRGRALLFVVTLARGYHLKLFLDQFDIPACAFNSQLPVHSRCHVITQFNRGICDYISKCKDAEYGLAQSIDFQNVAAVINFGMPPTVDPYIHRVGRTACANNPGKAFTLALPEEQEGLAYFLISAAGACPEENHQAGEGHLEKQE